MCLLGQNISSGGVWYCRRVRKKRKQWVCLLLALWHLFCSLFAPSQIGIVVVVVPSPFLFSSCCTQLLQLTLVWERNNFIRTGTITAAAAEFSSNHNNSILLARFNYPTDCVCVYVIHQSRWQMYSKLRVSSWQLLAETGATNFSSSFATPFVPFSFGTQWPL